MIFTPIGFHKDLITAQNFPEESSVISVLVSKLCCPICWELLSILRPNDAFHVRDHHSTVYPVELLSWLPDDTVQEMLDRFTNFLSSEITTMIAEDRIAPKQGHLGTTSLESNSGLSVASDDSDQFDLAKGIWPNVIPFCSSRLTY